MEDVFFGLSFRIPDAGSDQLAVRADYSPSVQALSFQAFLHRLVLMIFDLGVESIHEVPNRNVGESRIEFP